MYWTSFSSKKCRWARPMLMSLPHRFSSQLNPRHRCLPVVLRTFYILGRQLPVMRKIISLFFPEIHKNILSFFLNSCSFLQTRFEGIFCPCLCNIFICLFSEIPQLLNLGDPLLWKISYHLLSKHIVERCEETLVRSWTSQLSANLNPDNCSFLPQVLIWKSCEQLRYATSKGDHLLFFCVLHVFHFCHNFWTK